MGEHKESDPTAGTTFIYDIDEDVRFILEMLTCRFEVSELEFIAANMH